MMKKSILAFIIVFVLVLCLLLNSCSRQPNTQANTNTEVITIDSIGDSSYESVSKVEDLKCKVSFQEKEFTIGGKKAKELNKLISENISKCSEISEPVGDEDIYLEFYSGNVNNPQSVIYYGTYFIFRDKTVAFKAAPYISALLYYDASPTLYDDVYTFTGVGND